MTGVVRYQRNTLGRDFAVGDIHGHFSKLQAALDAAGFNPASDRLFSVGDLVDRGPESAAVLDWLDKPWFFAVQGNHEDMAIQHVRRARIDNGVYLANGGAWFLASSWDEQSEYAARFADLPVAIEVETEAGLVGIVHADCPFPSWDRMREVLNGITSTGLKGMPNEVQAACQWSRGRIDSAYEGRVDGVRAIVVGHTPVREALTLGNVHYIDTGAWLKRHFTLINLATLDCIPPGPAKLDWGL